MTRPTQSLLLALALAIQTGTATAQMTGDMHGMSHGDAPAAGAFGDAMDAMMEEMAAVEPTGDADVDFLLMMIPHHRSAVDMAQELLAEANDPEVAALAQSVIDTQEAEIAEMRAMLQRLGHPVE